MGLMVTHLNNGHPESTSWPLWLLVREDKADMIKLNILKWRVYSGLSGWALSTSTSVIRGALGRLQTEEEKVRDYRDRGCSDVTASWEMPAEPEVGGDRYRLSQDLLEGVQPCQNFDLGWFKLILGTSLVARMVKSLPTMWQTRVQSLGQEDPQEKEMATLSSILAWRIPWMEEPSRLQSIGSQRVGHDWMTNKLILDF